MEEISKKDNTIVNDPVISKKIVFADGDEECGVGAEKTNVTYVRQAGNSISCAQYEGPTDITTENSEKLVNPGEPRVVPPEPEERQQNLETQQQFREALFECRAIFYDKLEDYGASWRILRPASVTDQLFIKAARIRNLQEMDGVTYVGEGIYPEFQAIVNYGIIALIQMENGASLCADFDKDEAIRQYDQYLSDAFDLMCKKNADYHEAWRYMRISSYVDFILVKLNRIRQIEDNDGKTNVSEGIASNYTDIVNYAIFGLIKLTESGL